MSTLSSNLFFHLNILYMVFKDINILSLQIENLFYNQFCGKKVYV